MNSWVMIKTALWILYIMIKNAPESNATHPANANMTEEEWRELTCNKSLQLHWGGVIEHIMKSYDKQMLPNPTGVEVTIEMSIQDISALSELTSDFEIDVMFSEIWRDPALSFTNMSLCRRNLTLKPDFKGRIWTPDTCIVNSKKAVVHTSPSENSFVILYENGTVWANVRMQVKAPCRMDLKMFPFDTQRCSLIIESYSYNSQEVRLRWFGKDPITVNPTELPDFIVNGHETEHKRVDYPNGFWDQMKVTFTFSRRSGFYVFQAYFPTTLTVISSWIGFCLESRSVSARVTLGVSSLLALAFQFGTVLRHLPRVSYIKCIDVWMISCVAFIFFTLVEMSIVSQLATWEREVERSRHVVSRWLEAVRRKRSKAAVSAQRAKVSAVSAESSSVDVNGVTGPCAEGNNNSCGAANCDSGDDKSQNGVIRRNINAASTCVTETTTLGPKQASQSCTVPSASPRPSRWLTLLRDIKECPVEVSKPIVRDTTNNSLAAVTTCGSPSSIDLTPGAVRSQQETIKLISDAQYKPDSCSKSGDRLRRLRDRISSWIPRNIKKPTMESVRQIFPSIKQGVRKLEITSQKVDRLSMALFPLSFVLFNVCYWGIYFSMRRSAL